MTNEQIRKVFEIPEKDLLCFLLAKVNLTEKEKEVLENCLIKGYTEEYSAERMQISRNGLQKIKKKAYNKLINIWSNDTIVHMLLKR